MSTVGLDLADVAAALATRLADVTGIVATYDHIPDRVPVAPAALVGFGPVAYTGRAGAGATEAVLDVWLLVARPPEADSQRTLRRLLSYVPPASGDGTYSSIAEALAADRTLGGVCSASQIDPEGTSGPIEVVTFAQVDFLATSIPIRVHA